MTSTSTIMHSILSYNPFLSSDETASEAEQMLCNALVWSVIPAGFELFLENVEGKFVMTTFALGILEQFVENRIKVTQSTARRFIPLVTTAAVIGGSLVGLTLADQKEFKTVAAVTSISSLILAFIKSTTNKPYPSIMPIARKVASFLPIVGGCFEEKAKLF